MSQVSVLKKGHIQCKCESLHWSRILTILQPCIYLYSIPHLGRRFPVVHVDGGNAAEQQLDVGDSAAAPQGGAQRVGEEHGEALPERLDLWKYGTHQAILYEEANVL